MRIVYFGSGSPMSAAPLRTLVDHHDISFVVMPPRVLGRKDRIKRWFGRLEPTPLDAVVRGKHLLSMEYEKRSLDELRRRVIAAKPDLIVISSFPAILPAEILVRPAINLHSALLPKHRGADPLFWTYHANDAEAGSSIHWVTSGVDEGDILAMDPIPLRRGRPLLDLYLELVERGAALMAQTVAAIDSGVARGVPQDPGLATHDPSPMKRTWRIESDSWSAERTWHFLSGIIEMYGGICNDASGRSLPLKRRSVVTWEPATGPQRPGAVEIESEVVRFFCVDGVVSVRSGDPGPSGPRESVTERSGP